MIQLKIGGVAALFLLAACNNTATKEEGKKNPDSAQAAPVQPPQATSPQAIRINDDNLQAVYQQYLKLSKALTDGDATAAKLASNALEAGAREIPGGSALARAAGNITSGSSIETQRSHFSALSNEMVAMIKKAGMKSGAIYVDYCPMALNDKGAYWLSSEKGIRNPYFGEVMLSCGEVKETIQ